jgi:hypothetical protein
MVFPLPWSEYPCHTTKRALQDAHRDGKQSGEGRNLLTEWQHTEHYMIKKDKNGYKVVSEKGKNLGSGYKTRAAAVKRLRQVEYFKHKKG